MLLSALGAGPTPGDPGRIREPRSLVGRAAERCGDPPTRPETPLRLPAGLQVTSCPRGRKVSNVST